MPRSGDLPFLHDARQRAWATLVFIGCVMLILPKWLPLCFAKWGKGVGGIGVNKTISLFLSVWFAMACSIAFRFFACFRGVKKKPGDNHRVGRDKRIARSSNPSPRRSRQYDWGGRPGYCLPLRVSAGLTPASPSLPLPSGAKGTLICCKDNTSTTAKQMATKCAIMEGHTGCRKRSYYACHPKCCPRKN